MAEDIQILPARRSPHAPTVRDLAAVFFRHQRLLVASFVGVVSAGMLYFVLFPSYKAEMKILVRRGRIDPVITPTPSPSPAFEHDEISEEELNSEVELLRDNDLLRQVVADTRLAAATWWSKVMRPNSEARTESAVRRLAQKLEVTPVRKSRLITVSYTSSSPERSAAVLRSLARVYIAKHAELRRPAGEQTFFEEQVNESRRALEQAQANLIAYTRREGVVSAELERDLLLHKLSDAEASAMELEAAIAEASERLKSLDVKLSNLPERRIVEIRNADNPELQGKLKAKLLELQLRRTELLTKFQPSYRLVQEVDEQIAEAKSAIEGEDRKQLRDEVTRETPEYEWARSERLKAEIDLRSLAQKEIVAHQQVAEYRAAAQRLEEGSVVQHDLQQKLKSAEDKWLLYANKQEEARIGDALDQNGVLNVAISEQPHAPALPAWSFLGAGLVSLIGACGVSTGLVFAADYLDPSFRTPEELFDGLGLPVLASFPARVNNSLRPLEAS